MPIIALPLQSNHVYHKQGYYELKWITKHPPSQLMSLLDKIEVTKNGNLFLNKIEVYWKDSMKKLMQAW